MKNLKIVFEYDGSEYFGFQKQEKQKTIQGELESVLSKIFNEPIEIIGAGRTDRGVHANNQVASFFTNSQIPVEKLTTIINRRLSNAIRVKNTEEVDENFNARFSAIGREYVYLMKEIKDYNVFESRYVTYVEKEIKVENFVENLLVLKGKKNFDSFRKSDCNAANPVREIKEISMKYENGTYKFYIKADGFLKSMVRIIVGSGLDVYFGKKEKNYIIKNLENPDKQGMKVVAPPNGLYLNKVEY